jgi:hypothetical protein
VVPGRAGDGRLRQAVLVVPIEVVGAVADLVAVGVVAETDAAVAGQLVSVVVRVRRA